jgi:hypothetical protein
MSLSDPVLITRIVAYGAFTWVGLYLLVRTPRYPPLIIVSLLALFGQACFFALGVLLNATRDPVYYVELERWTWWWSAVLPTAAWFHISSLIRGQIRRARPAIRSEIFSPLVIIIYAMAATITLVGSSTNLFINFDGLVTRARDDLFAPPGPLYPAYIAYNGLVTGGALINFVWVLRRLASDPQPGNRALLPQLRVLTAGGLLFFVGALWLSLNTYNWRLELSVLPGYLSLLIGLIIIGYGIADFGMLLEGQNIRRDFFYSLTSIVLVNLLYASLLPLSGQQSIPVLLMLIGMVTLTHTAFDNGRAVLDTFFFSRDERTARAEARNYATALGTTPAALPSFASMPAETSSTDESELDDSQPDQTGQSSTSPGPAATPEDTPPATPVPTIAPKPLPASSASPPQPAYASGITRVPKHFKDNVRKAITNLKNPPQLARSPLLALALVEQRMHQIGQDDNRLNRAATLREVLIEQIEALQPNDSASSKVGDAWRFYNVLYYPYVREISRKGALTEARRLAEARQRSGQREASEIEQVLGWLADIDENTFYKWQRRASDTIATILWEETSKLAPLPQGSSNPHTLPQN